MSFIVEQKIHGRIYLYEATSHWNKDKKLSRQTRKYLGPKDGQDTVKKKKKSSNLVSKNFGNIGLLNHISKELGLTSILQEAFPENYLEILALANYTISEGIPFYMFPYWLEEQNLSGVKKLGSTAISNLCDDLGRSEKERIDFITEWSKAQNPKGAIYYDITSISSYSTNIDFVEWGYNRDQENLAQINMGVMCNSNNSLPIFYNLYPGSINDVSTLKNCIKYSDSFIDLKEIAFVLDRGFFSKKNILEMDKSNIKFIQPVSFSLKQATELVAKHKKQITNPKNVLKYNEEIIYHTLDKINIDHKTFDAHIFFNEKAHMDQKHRFLSALLEIEGKIKDKKFTTMKECLSFKKENIPEKYQQYFKWNKSSLAIEKNIKKIRAYNSRAGFFLITANHKVSNINILTHYRKRDCVEKLFDNSKNEMDGKRLRSHSTYTNNGKLFIKFIALILHSQISNYMNKSKLFKNYSLKELLTELKKIKISQINGQDSFVSEISKKQRTILSGFGIDVREFVKT